MQSSGDTVKIYMNFIIDFIKENGIVLSLVFLLIAVIYINHKVNDLNYRLLQTIMYQPLKPSFI